MLGGFEVSNLLFGVVVATILVLGGAAAGVMSVRGLRETRREARVSPSHASRPAGLSAVGTAVPTTPEQDSQRGGSLLDFFSKGAIQELRPVRDAQYGVRYIEIENLTKVEPRNVPALLERLAARGVLLRRTYERRIVCEVCNSSDLSPRYECTTCRSNNLERERVIEHVSCGHSGPTGMFERRSDMLVCPHCGVEFGSSGPEVNPRAGEVVYSCQDCGASTRQPGVFFHCGGCGATVPTNGVAFANLYSYALARDSDLQSVVLLELISSMLREMGYDVQIPGTMKGRSGITQRFGLVFGIGGQVGVVTVVQAMEATSELELRETFVSAYDCTPCLHVMISIPNAGDSVKKLAAQYKAHVIEGGDVKGILRLFRSYAIGLRSTAQREKRQALAETSALAPLTSNE